VEIAEGATAGDLLAHLAGAHPRLEGIARHLLLSVNREYADRSALLKAGDEVALIPPVSGGAEAPLFEISEAPLSVKVARRSSGAIATFTGVVREHSRGRRVDHLEYEAYPEMALAKMREIADEIRAKWEVDAVAMSHRVGRLEVGEASVVIAAAAPHRQQALEACAYAIERLKVAVPIWKKEVWTDGSEWIGLGS
jgi:molybdopterin synthase catalytic subunit